MGLLEAIILSVLAASTPLLIAATGELVTERAGVLNLGVEGMMIVGAACGFGGAWLTGSTIIGALCGIVAGALLSLIFAAMTLAAHALGYPVLRIRMFAVMFGGACAGLAGAYLPLAYTPFFIPGMTAGRGWIALALVVFSSWRPARLVVGAYLFGAVTILQLHAQGAGFGIPSQFMSALPYLATVIVLVLISRARTGGSTAPAALGTVFVPDR